MLFSLLYHTKKSPYRRKISISLLFQPPICKIILHLFPYHCLFHRKFRIIKNSKIIYIINHVTIKWLISTFECWWVSIRSINIKNVIHYPAPSHKTWLLCSFWYRANFFGLQNWHRTIYEMTWRGFFSKIFSNVKLPKKIKCFVIESDFKLVEFGFVRNIKSIFSVLWIHSN